ncbi:class I SAM-dependent methyltransferase [Streptomyces roseirectus]|uniref:Class I SAM-dependent methyltransferase n=1 Tax=Streptomyces roseirectus TaxID=2768066 RepID=A0A7H0ITL6_9ACTN|nr:class I SAM-dependent methyltransferase [Streptomyces roseirectus]
MSPYLFDNSAPQGADRFAALEAAYDAVSRRQLELTGLAAGWRCLEVGGGGGSLGSWLGERVGPGGEVTVTDLDLRWAVRGERPDQVRLMRHDIVRDPLPEGAYDLVHARLVLMHLPDRHQVLNRLVTALRPGGWLVLEDFDCTPVRVLSDPGGGAGPLFEKVHGAVMRLLAGAGTDLGWGRHARGAMAKVGLTDLTESEHTEEWHGGGTEISLHRHNVAQTTDRLTSDEGISPDELARFDTLLENPSFAVSAYPLISVRGRRPHRMLCV